MNSEKLQQYQSGRGELPMMQYAWPLYGSGLESLGQNGAPVSRPVPEYGEDELLMRIDTVSLCYTDLKEIDQGQNHPRLVGRDLKTNPIVPGHELSMTVVGVGEKLRGGYAVGQRYTLQPDVWVDGKSIPFCFGMDGAYRQYAKIDGRILHGDAGNYLIPVPEGMTYAASAITEPWACVEAAYRMEYRPFLMPKGNAWFVGGAHPRSGYQIDEFWIVSSKPGRIYITDLPLDLEAGLRATCERQAIELVKTTRDQMAETGLDDILLLDCEPEAVWAAAARLNTGGIVALLNAEPMSGPIEIDLGRLHYDEILYVGSASLNIADAYQATFARAELKPGGIAWILGAGGPMGRMHLQRGIEAQDGPRLIVASEVSDSRLEALRTFFGPLAEKNGKELWFTNPVGDRAGFEALLQAVRGQGGFDDIEVMITIPAVIAEAADYLAVGGTVNIFAGMKRGVSMAVDSHLIWGEPQARFVGHSGSGLDDQKAVVERCMAGQLEPNLSVAAVAGLRHILAGIKATQAAMLPGKIVIYPQILDLPLTPLAELRERHPEVYEKLGPNATWTLEAENAFLEIELP